MLGRTDSRPRSLLIVALLAGFGIACIARLGYWQVLRHDDLVARAREQVTAQIEVPPVRGTIYDRTGTVVLATSVERDLLSAFPAQMTGATDADTAALRASIAAQAGRDPGPRPDRCRRPARQAGQRQRVRRPCPRPHARPIGGDQGRPRRRVAGAAAPGAGAGARLSAWPVGRSGTTLAAQLLGFVNRDGTGQYGVEGRWQDLLAGSPQVLLAERDGSGRPILDNAQTLQAGSPGTSLTLTIDASLQLKLEQEVYAAWVGDQCRERLRRGDGPEDRRDPRLGDVSEL